MGKIKKFKVDRYAPFEIPEDDDELVFGEKTVHVHAFAFTSVVRDDIKWFVGEDFDKWVEVVASRGAERGKDYVITLHTDGGALPIITLHTTDRFLSKEDL